MRICGMRIGNCKDEINGIILLSDSDFGSKLA